MIKFEKCLQYVYRLNKVNHQMFHIFHSDFHTSISFTHTSKTNDKYTWLTIRVLC